MNKKLEEFKLDIKNKKVAVLGIGVSNTPLIEYLLKLGVNVTAFDRADREKLEPTISNFESLGMKYSLGERYLENLVGFDIVFRTPGMRPDLPELVKAKENGADITSEMEVFLDLCPAQVFAVTGSDGKTTTTTLIYNMLKQQGYNCWLGGNIGTPLLSKIDEVKESDKVVLELSSFQLQTISKSADVAVITNVSPNHLDVHKSMEEYVEAKKNIFRYQKKSELLMPKVVLNFDNDITKAFADEAVGNVVFFSRVNNLENGTVYKDGKLLYRNNGADIELVDSNEIVIPGVHNIENYLAAAAAVIDFVSPDTIRKVATTFPGVEHRIELVRELDGIKFYNDSIASSPSRTIAGLKSFNQRVILIAGGKDKNIPYDSIGEVLVERVKCLILIGQTAPKIEKSLKDAIDRTGKGKDIKIINCSTYEEVVKTAYSNAAEGDIVILSPASTSFDMFKNFEERGNRFKDIVNRL
ncbi:MAG: UDP-N-acetylmuramoyl-L-alanine--D-glutamate ligase [Clostridia bacterium]|nr:UDP-N-acetylmuramoyl-L-alanine--D-glutamate ligase [Clostridia bacterium]